MKIINTLDCRDAGFISCGKRALSLNERRNLTKDARKNIAYNGWEKSTQRWFILHTVNNDIWNPEMGCSQNFGKNHPKNVSPGSQSQPDWKTNCKAPRPWHTRRGKEGSACGSTRWNKADIKFTLKFGLEITDGITKFGVFLSPPTLLWSY